MDPFITKVNSRPVGGAYELIEQIASGGFGHVYLARDVKDDKRVALKLESKSSDYATLEWEDNVYADFQQTIGFPRVYWSGEHDYFKSIALELLEPTLLDLFAYCGGKFSLKTTLLIADQLLPRLQDLHGKDYVHRDVKPNNFLVGTGPKGSTLHICDFGLVDYVEDPANPHDPYLDLFVVGNPRFASISGHEGRALSPKDDLESLGYMLIYFLQGKLPWDNLPPGSFRKQAQQAEQLKTTTRVEELCKGLPTEFAEYMRTVKGLGQGQRPDYAAIRSDFRKLAQREGFEYDFVFDWTERAIMEKEHPGDWTSGLL